VSTSFDFSLEYILQGFRAHKGLSLASISLFLIFAIFIVLMLNNKVGLQNGTISTAHPECYSNQSLVTTDCEGKKVFPTSTKLLVVSLMFIALGATVFIVTRDIFTSLMVTLIGIPVLAVVGFFFAFYFSYRF